MQKRFRKAMTFFARNANIFHLAWILLFGYLLGIFLAAQAPETYYSLMRRTALSPVSIVSGCACAFLPFLFAFAAVYVGKPALLLLVCFCKALMLSHCSFCCYLAFGSGAWLVCLFLQFSDILLMPLLCRFAIGYLDQPKALRLRDVFLYCGITVLVSIVNFYFISPYLAMLIDM